MSAYTIHLLYEYMQTSTSDLTNFAFLLYFALILNDIDFNNWYLLLFYSYYLFSVYFLRFCWWTRVSNFIHTTEYSPELYGFIHVPLALGGHVGSDCPLSISRFSELSVFCKPVYKTWFKSVNICPFMTRYTKLHDFQDGDGGHVESGWQLPVLHLPTLVWYREPTCQNSIEPADSI
jgi:hypothetical protein